MESPAPRSWAEEKSRIDFMLDGIRVFSVLVKEDTICDRQVSNLSEEDTADFEVIGTAEGINFAHCVYLGNKYEKDFFKKVGGFQLAKPDDSEYNIAVTFYKPKKSS